MYFKDLTPQHLEQLDMVHAALKNKETRHQRITVSGLYLLAMACNRINYPSITSARSYYYLLEDIQKNLKQISAHTDTLLQTYKAQVSSPAGSPDIQQEVLIRASSAMMQTLCLAMEAVSRTSAGIADNQYQLLDLIELTLDKRVKEEEFKVAPKPPPAPKQLPEDHKRKEP